MPIRFDKRAYIFGHDDLSRKFLEDSQYRSSDNRSTSPGIKMLHDKSLADKPVDHSSPINKPTSTDDKWTKPDEQSMSPGNKSSSPDKKSLSPDGFSVDSQSKMVQAWIEEDSVPKVSNDEYMGPI